MDFLRPKLSDALRRHFPTEVPGDPIPGSVTSLIDVVEHRVVLPDLIRNIVKIDLKALKSPKVVELHSPPSWDADKMRLRAKVDPALNFHGSESITYEVLVIGEGQDPFLCPGPIPRVHSASLQEHKRGVDPVPRVSNERKLEVGVELALGEDVLIRRQRSVSARQIPE